jgi:hypothetical protein
MVHTCNPSTWRGLRLGYTARPCPKKMEGNVGALFLENRGMRAPLKWSVMAVPLAN